MDEQQMQQGPAPEQAQAPAPEQAPQGGQLPAPNPEVTSPVVQAHMDELEQMRSLMDAKTGQAYDRVLTAGMKMLYSPESAEMVTSLVMNDEVPVPNKLGEGVGNLLIMMDNQGNGTIPKEVIIPVGVALMFEAADYLFECGIEITEEDMGQGLELLLTTVMTGYGIDTAKMDQIIDDMGKRLGFEEGAGAVGGEEVAAPEDVAATEEAAFNQGFTEEQQARGV